MSQIQKLSEDIHDVGVAFKEYDERWRGELSTLGQRVDRLDAKVDEQADTFGVRLQKTGLDISPAGRPVQGTRPFLSLEQRAAQHFRAESPEYDAGEVRMGALVAAMVAGQRVAGQLSAPEIQAIGSTILGPTGGYVVPEAIGAIFIDSVRPRLRVLQAGARTYPMEAAVVHLPGWDDKLVAAWRGESSSFSEQTPDFRRITLAAKSIAVRVRLPVELLEDSDKNLDPITEIIEDEVGRAIAEGIDFAALLGAGTDNQPLGLMNLETSTGINQVSMGANGATPADYDTFLDALYELEADNFEASAVIWNPRTPHTLSKIVTGIAGDKTKLEPPARIAELAKLPTNQVPINQTQGSATDASTAFFGDWSQLVIGFRPNMSMRALQDPYTEGKDGVINLYAYMRADIAALQPKAFCRLVGIKG